ncbi:EF-hand domain-containing protein [Streptomyces rectiviolaceus]|uniref:Calcium binding protein CalD n=1 Tax=Streptomyces rectiviolaceus TaxID=332591 RepID=A0ABP6MGJ3_9ACTN
MAGTDLRAKYAHRFHTRDANGDGFVDRADVVARAEQLLDGMGVAAASPRGEAVLAGAHAVWQGLAKAAQIPEDGQLNEQAYVRAMERANESGTIADLLRPSVEAHVALIDSDGDGTVSLEEFVRAQKAVGEPAASRAREAFAALDRDGDGRVTVEEWQQAVMEYYTSTDADAPGNLVLGLRA